MGASSSCKIYQQFSNAISSVAQHHHGINHIQNYLDNYLIISDGLASGKRDLVMFKSMAASINLPLAQDKIDGPKPVPEFLGIELDYSKMEARLCGKKLSKGNTWSNHSRYIKDPQGNVSSLSMGFCLFVPQSSRQA